MQEVKNPYPIFLGLDGLALELGYIYIGLENQDPETNPKSCFWDADGTQSATQPIRTLAGYPDRLGSPAQIFTSGKYSIRVRDALGNRVFYLASAGESESVTAGQPYLVHCQFLGDSPSVQSIVMLHVFGADVSFEEDWPDQAFFYTHTVPGSDAAYDIQYDGVSIGTLTFDTSGDITVVCSALDAAQGHRLTLVAPASSTSMKDFGGVIVGATA
jgi:hypothetical protein